jgi:hypothetical protein
MAGDRSLFEEARSRRFFERVCAPLLESNILRFSILRWRDETLAYHLGFLYDGVYTWYLPSFNVDFSRYSPGEVLLRKLLEDALESRVREFDFTLGDSPHKERFANLKRRNSCVEIASNARAASRPTAIDSATGVRRRKGTLGEKLLARWRRHPTAPQPLRTDPDASAAPRHPRLGVSRRRLWRTSALDPRPSEFRVRWARYSHIKALVRQEGLRSQALMTALARMRRGQRAVVVLWQERPIAVLWLARDTRAGLMQRGFDLRVPDGAALLVEAHLASDLEGSPRREALMPAVQTFLVAEGVTALYGVDDPATGPSLPERCGVPLFPVMQRSEIGLLFGTVRFLRKLRGFDEGLESR